jgi:hypothetical protein
MAQREYTPGMDLGTGIDSLSGAIRGDGVIRTEAEEVTGASGQTISFHLEKIETIEDLQEALSISADMEFSAVFASGSARFDFAESCQMHRYALYLMARVEVMNSFRQMRDVRLKQQPLDLLKNGQTERFREQLGDFYIRGMATGGVFVSVLEITARSEQHQKTISAEMEASGGFGMFEASGQFSQSLKTALEGKSIQVRSFQQGGEDVRQPTTPDEMVAKARNFPSQVAGGKAVPYEVLLMDYRTLDLPFLPNWVDLQNAREVLQDLWILRNQLRKTLNDIHYILVPAHQGLFELDKDKVSQLNKSAQLLAETLNTVTREASKCINRPLEAKYPEDLRFPDIGDLPALKGGAPQRVVISPNRKMLRRIVEANLKKQEIQPRRRMKLVLRR